MSFEKNENNRLLAYLIKIQTTFFTDIEEKNSKVSITHKNTYKQNNP